MVKEPVQILDMVEIDGQLVDMVRSDRLKSRKGKPELLLTMFKPDDLKDKK